jgi:tetratricopeptide (TPR) repeat protein
MDSMKALLITAALFAPLVALGAAAAHAQSLKLPDQSPAASVSQTIGITEVTVAYHRPAVNGRVIWGKLVPYGEPWRTGANENTLITFSTDVKVNGKPLHAGTYGLHALPTQKDWTFMFSNATRSWGSFSYDQKEDALRVTATPRALANNEERMAFRFEDLSDTKGTLVLAWEKLAVPMTIEADTPKLVMAGARADLRGPVGFNWNNYTRAVNYWLKNGGPLDEAGKMADQALQMEERYATLNAKANVLEKQGKAKDAADLRAKAMAAASEHDLDNEAYRLMGDKKYDDAVKICQTNISRHPDSAGPQDTLGNVLQAKGDKAGAVAAFTKALSLAKDPQAKKDIQDELNKAKS